MSASIEVRYMGASSCRAWTDDPRVFSPSHKRTAADARTCAADPDPILIIGGKCGRTPAPADFLERYGQNCYAGTATQIVARILKALYETHRRWTCPS